MLPQERDDVRVEIADRSRPLPSFTVRRNWNPAFRIITVLPMRILLLRPVTHLPLTLHDAAGRNPPRGRAFGV